MLLRAVSVSDREEAFTKASVRKRWWPESPQNTFESYFCSNHLQVESNPTIPSLLTDGSSEVDFAKDDFSDSATKGMKSQEFSLRSGRESGVWDPSPSLTDHYSIGYHKPEWVRVYAFMSIKAKLQVNCMRLFVSSFQNPYSILLNQRSLPGGSGGNAAAEGRILRWPPSIPTPHVYTVCIVSSPWVQAEPVTDRRSLLWLGFKSVVFCFIDLFLFIFGCAGSSWLHIGFLSCSRRGLLFAAVHGPLPESLKWLLRWGAQAIRVQASVVAALRFSNCCMGLAAPWHVESSQTRGRTHVPWTGRWLLICCTTREVCFCFLIVYFVLEKSQLTMLSEFQVDRKGTQPYLYTYPFSLKLLAFRLL